MAAPVFRGIDPPDQFLILQTLAEIGDRLVIGDQPAAQPHDLQVTAGFALEPPARLHPVEIAVDVKLQQKRRVIGRPARGLRIDTAKPQAAQIKSLDKGLDHPDRIVLRNKIFKRFRKERDLTAIQTLDKALHHKLPTNPGESYQHPRFYT